MKTKKLLLAAGMVLAGVSAASAESGFEPRNDVPNGPLVKNERQILHFSGQRSGASKPGVKQAQPTNSDINRTRNTGFSRGYTTFEVLDSIQ